MNIPPVTPVTDWTLWLPGRHVVAPERVEFPDVEPAVGDHRVSPSLLHGRAGALWPVGRHEAPPFVIGFGRSVGQNDLAVLAMDIQPAAGGKGGAAAHEIGRAHV